MKKCGAFSGKAEARIAAIVAKHSLRTFISVTRMRRGCFVLQQEPSACTCQDSGKNSPMTTYSFETIFFTRAREVCQVLRGHGFVGHGNDLGVSSGPKAAEDAADGRGGTPAAALVATLLAISWSIRVCCSGEIVVSSAPVPS